MMTRMFRTLAVIAAAVSASAALGASVANQVGDDSQPLNSTSNLPPLGSVTKQINIDGHPVNVTVSVSNINFLLLVAQRPSSIRVELASADLQDLPNVTAIRVKLERVRPPMRIVRSTLIPDTTFAADPTRAGYGAYLTPFAPNAQLKATVTVVTPDETRMIRVGTLRVQPAIFFPFVPVGPILQVD